MTSGVVDQPTQPGTALTVERPPVRMMRPIAEPSHLIQVQEETRALVEKALKDGRDYGLVPGTDRKSLFKAGAERINNAFGCYPQFRTVESEVDHDREVQWVKRRKEFTGAKGNRRFKGWVEESGTSVGLYRYVVECELIDRATGQVVASYQGSCSTMEGKYVDRPRELENTVLKMAQKRAFVGATLVAFGLSDQFSDIGAEEEQEEVIAGEPEPEQLTLETALAIPFPWRTPPKYAGKPLSVLSDRMLDAVATQSQKKLDEMGEDAYYARLLGAVRLIQKSREATKTEVRAEVPMPGQGVEALDPNEPDPQSYQAKVKRLRELMQHEAIPGTWRVDLSDAIAGGLRDRDLEDAIARCERKIEEIELALR